MENQLDLNIILDFLVDNNHTQNFNNVKNTDKINLEYLENFNSKNFKYFNNIFGNHIDRVGINSYFNHFNSLYYSVIFLLYKDFCLLDLEQQVYFIKCFKSKIKDDIINRKCILPKKFKKLALSTLKNNQSNNYDLYLLSFFLKINIFLFSYDSNDITAFYEDKQLNIYKTNIFINKINNIYYPLNYKNNNGYFFKYNSTIFKTVIFSKDIKAFDLKEKEFIISNSWEEILGKYLSIDISNMIFDIELNNYLEDSNDSDSPINIDNLTEELQKINDKNINFDSDLDLSDNDSLNIDSEDVNNINENEELVNEINNYSDNQLKKLKKDKLINYLSLLLNRSDTEFKKMKKNLIIKNLKEEVNKFI